MPPVFENDQVVCFYRPCWNAHERGPPAETREQKFALIRSSSSNTVDMGVVENLDIRTL